MDEQRQDDQHEPTYSSSVPIRDVALETSQKQWTIEMGGKRGSGISVLIARHDDDDDDRHNNINNNSNINTGGTNEFISLRLQSLATR